MDKPKEESPKLTAPIHRECTRWFDLLNFGSSSYLKRDHKKFTCLHRNTKVTKEKKNNILLLAASNGCWWLHEASPCNCWKNTRQMRTRRTYEFYRRMKMFGITQWWYSLHGFLHSFFSSLARSNRKCCSGLFAKDQGGRCLRNRRRSSPPPASTI